MLRFIIISRLLFHVIYDYLSARYVNGIKSVPRHSLITRTYILFPFELPYPLFFLWNDLHSYFNKNFEIKGGICYWSSRNLWNWQQEISRKKGMKICQKKFCYACQCLTHNQPDNVTKHPITNWLISWRVIDSWHIIIAFIMTLFLMRFSHLLRHGVK